MPHLINIECGGCMGGSEKKWQCETGAIFRSSTVKKKCIPLGTTSSLLQRSSCEKWVRSMLPIRHEPTCWPSVISHHHPLCLVACSCFVPCWQKIRFHKYAIPSALKPLWTSLRRRIHFLEKTRGVYVTFLFISISKHHSTCWPSVISHHHPLCLVASSVPTRMVLIETSFCFTLRKNVFHM